MTESNGRLYIILLGPPGAGKGTQSQGLAQCLGLAHVASGDIFRWHVAQDTSLGRRAKAYMERGLLVPDEVTIPMVLDRLGQDDVARGAVLDGFPRTIEQAKALDARLEERSERIDRVINLSVGVPELIRRLSGRWLCRSCQTPYRSASGEPEIERCRKCGGDLYQREDDRATTVARRLDVYFEATKPLIEYYRADGKLVEVNGEQTVEAVRHDLSAAAKGLSVG